MCDALFHFSSSKSIACGFGSLAAFAGAETVISSEARWPPCPTGARDPWRSTRSRHLTATDALDRSIRVCPKFDRVTGRQATCAEAGGVAASNVRPSARIDGSSPSQADYSWRCRSRDSDPDVHRQGKARRRARGEGAPTRLWPRSVGAMALSSMVFRWRSSSDTRRRSLRPSRRRAPAHGRRIPRQSARRALAWVRKSGNPVKP
jgi:hypothetical protein